MKLWKLAFAFTLALAALRGSSVQAQLWIDFDGFTINDGGLGDLDGLVNSNITFLGIYGNGNYQVSGDLYRCPPGTPGATLLGLLTPVTDSLTLTNFAIDAVSTSTPGQTVNIQFADTVFGSFGGVTGAAAISPFVGSLSNLPVPALSDTLLNYDVAIFDNLNAPTPLLPASGAFPYFNPAHPGPGTTAWTVHTMGPMGLPNLVNPTIQGRLSVTLGAFDDRFQLLSSAEVGFYAETPEPGSVVLLSAGVVAGAWIVRRRRKVGSI